MNQLDIRMPMGSMFSLLGGVLTVYGGISNGSQTYSRSLNINVNLWWGAVILVFGGTLLGLSWRAGKRLARHPQAATSPVEEIP